MLSKNRIKYIKSLQLKKNRLQESKFVVEGDKIIRELLDSSYDIITIYATKNWIESHKEFLKSAVDKITEVEYKQLKAASSFSTASEVIAEVKMPQDTVHNIQEVDDSLILYLDGIRDPGNMGTIIRTAAWFGHKQIFCSPDSVDFYNNKVLQASMGSFAHLNMKTLNIDSLKAEFRNHKLIGATLYGTPLTKFIKPDRMILIIGNEGQGISSPLLAECDEQLTISKSPNSKIESLNAAISCSILLHTLQ